MDMKEVHTAWLGCGDSSAHCVAGLWSKKDFSPDIVEHRLLSGGGLGDGSLGAHHLALVLLLARLAVLVLVGFRSAVLFAGSRNRGSSVRIVLYFLSNLL